MPARFSDRALRSGERAQASADRRRRLAQQRDDRRQRRLPAGVLEAVRAHHPAIRQREGPGREVQARDVARHRPRSVLLPAGPSASRLRVVDDGASRRHVQPSTSCSLRFVPTPVGVGSRARTRARAPESAAHRSNRARRHGGRELALARAMNKRNRERPTSSAIGAASRNTSNPGDAVGGAASIAAPRHPWLVSPSGRHRAWLNERAGRRK